MLFVSCINVLPLSLTNTSPPSASNTISPPASTVRVAGATIVSKRFIDKSPLEYDTSDKSFNAEAPPAVAPSSTFKNDNTFAFVISVTAPSEPALLPSILALVTFCNLAYVIPSSFTLNESEFISIVESSTLTAKLLFADMSPPPVRPSPALNVTDVWSTCSFATKLFNESWSISAGTATAVIVVPLFVTSTPL